MEQRLSTFVSPSRSPRSDIEALRSSSSASSDEYLGANSANDFAGVEDWESKLVIESVALPRDGISTTDSGATVYAINVRLHGGLEWTVTKRYSELRELHSRVKATNMVKCLQFPKKHLMRLNSDHALEKRRVQLEAYVAGLLEITPPPRRELFNFLGVYARIKAFEHNQRAAVHERGGFDCGSESSFDWMMAVSNSERTLAKKVCSPATLTDDSCDEYALVSDYFREACPQLENLVEMCLHMDELVSMSEKVLERLFITRARAADMQFSAVPTIFMTSFVQVTTRFHAFLAQHADRLTVDRVASTETLVRYLYEFNSEIDTLESQIGLEESSWRSSWDDAVQSVDENLTKAWNSNAADLLTELPDEKSQQDALTLLRNEARRELKRGSSSQELIEVAAQTVARMSNSLTDEVPDRFIPEHEVQRDSRPFSSGSSGTVYRGSWMGVKVVIKYVEVNSSEDMHAFLQEDTIWNMARHPNIVTYYGACHLPRPCFFVSEDAVNGNVTEFLAKQKYYGRSLVWRMILGAAVGLRFLHRNNIIHGDMKGNNILVDTNEVAKLTDFGMSFIAGSTPTSSGGPVRWAAPECLIRKEAPSFASGIYSLGMCIVEAVTGIVPWGIHRSDVEIVDELAHRRFLPRPAQLSDDHWKLVSSLCAFEPRQRCTLSNAIHQLERFAAIEAEAEQQR
ncbi:unnamed protein product [Phytophthora lilii]|uniref:Unnamed protein product n=1 Tax=Phytophthora lilii TaxID=2077276 RepID=A0A9W6WV54_9STRA|nr:unnamed protein product [Phytophthora lilii]